MPLQLLLAPVYLVEFFLTQAIGQVALSALGSPAACFASFLLSVSELHECSNAMEAPGHATTRLTSRRLHAFVAPPTGLKALSSLQRGLCWVRLSPPASARSNPKASGVRQRNMVSMSDFRLGGDSEDYGHEGGMSMSEFVLADPAHASASAVEREGGQSMSLAKKSSVTNREDVHQIDLNAKRDYDHYDKLK